MKLHLGCGQVYLNGYQNIDFPLEQHTVQEKSIADEYADIRLLKYDKNSIEEVRLHHLFEHFPRHIAIALLAAWQTWLTKGGKIVIEVPDFIESSKLILNNNTNNRDRNIALRHIFGSNEAPWATHYEGWTKNNFINILKRFGFKDIKFEKSQYLATRNITVTATKGLFNLSISKAEKEARNYLREFTVNDSDFELHLLDIWLDEFKNQLLKNV